MPKEVFHHRIVQTVSLPRHALADPFLQEQIMICRHAILPPLIYMKDESCSIWNLLKGLLEHCGNLGEPRMILQDLADDLPVVQVQNWRQIEFLSEEMKLREVFDPFLMGFRRFKIGFYEVWRNGTNIAMKRVIALDPTMQYRFSSFTSRNTVLWFNRILLSWSVSLILR